jgi:hypothetical protein
METESPTRALALELRHGLIEDFRSIRNRIPKIKGNSNGASAGDGHSTS